MKKTLLMPLMALLLLFGATAPVVAEETLEEMEQRCRTYAEEDKIAPDELDEYLKECIDSIQQENADPIAEPEEEKKDQS